MMQGRSGLGFAQVPALLATPGAGLIWEPLETQANWASNWDSPVRKQAERGWQWAVAIKDPPEEEVLHPDEGGWGPGGAGLKAEGDPRSGWDRV